MTLKRIAPLLLASFALLVLTGSVVAAPITDAAVTPRAEADAPATPEAAADVEVSEPASIPALGLPSDDWRSNASEACRYSCPTGSPILCPENVNYTVSCVNNCCVYS